MKRVKLTKVSALVKTQVTVEFPTSEPWELVQATVTGDSRSKKAFLDDFELARGARGHFLDLDSLSIGDLSVALSGKLCLWVPDRPLEVEPEERELPEGLLW